MAAARAWATGTLVAAPRTMISQTHGALEDARAWGASDQEIEEIHQALFGAPSGGVPIWPANIEIVEAWCLVARQWRTSVVTGRYGLRTFWIALDFVAVRALLSAYRIKLTRELTIGLQLMERFALVELNGRGD